MTEQITDLPIPESENSNLEVLIIAGPSGSGKSTFVDLLLDDFRDELGNPRAVTTRAPRGDGIDHSQRIYTDEKGFQDMEKEGKMIGVITANNGNRYGFYRPDIELIRDSGKALLLDMTSFEHVEIMRQHYPQLKLIVISPFSDEEITDSPDINTSKLRDFFLPRLKARTEMPPEELEARLRGAANFLEQSRAQRKDALLVNTQEDNLSEVYSTLVDSVVSLLVRLMKK